MIDDLRGGVDSATERLWQSYFDRLALLVKGRLRAVTRAVADEEDIALSLFDSYLAVVLRAHDTRLREWGFVPVDVTTHLGPEGVHTHTVGISPPVAPSATAAGSSTGRDRPSPLSPRPGRP